MAETEARASTTPHACPLHKAEGALLCAAAGDALGWPQEIPRKNRGPKTPLGPSAQFRSWTRREGGRFYPHEEIVRRGEYSDDTQLTLAVARSRILGGNEWFPAFARTELPLWTLYQRGGGRATKQAAKSWLKGTPPWRRADLRERYFWAGGNGVAMRALPHAIWHCGADDPSHLIRDVVRDGTATHGHPRALIGAAAVAFAAWWLLRAERTVRYGELIEIARNGVGAWGRFPPSGNLEDEWLDSGNRTTGNAYESLWNEVSDELLGYLELARLAVDRGPLQDDREALAAMGCFGKQKGSGVVTAAASIYLCARYAVNPVEGVIAGAFAHGTDTDTLAAIAGGLLGSLAGIDRLPPAWHSVQDCDYVLAAANRLARKQPVSRENVGKPRNIGGSSLARIKRLLASNRQETFEFDGVRRARLNGSVRTKPLSRSTDVRIRELRTSDGQTLYVKNYARRPAHTAGVPTAGTPRAEAAVSANTAAVLLLTSSLAEGNGRASPDLLTADEYNRLAVQLRQIDKEPSDLMAENAWHLIDRCAESVAPKQLDRLLQRGPALNAAIARWNDRGIRVISRSDKEYPSKLRRGLRRQSPPLLFVRGDVALLSRPGIAVVGSSGEGGVSIEFAARAGSLAAKNGLALFSGGFTGIDRSAIGAARDAGGCAVTLAPLGPEGTNGNLTAAQAVPGKRLATVSTIDPIGGAKSASIVREGQTLLGLAGGTLVVQAEPREEYPWACATGLLSRQAGARVFVREAGVPAAGLESLQAMNTESWRRGRSMAECDRLVRTLAASLPVQTVLPLGWRDSRRDRTPAKGAEQAHTEVGLTETGVEDRQLAEELLEFVADLLNRARRKPAKPGELAKMQGVNRKQAESWMLSLADRGVVGQQAPRRGDPMR